MNEFESWPHAVLEGAETRVIVMLPDPHHGYYRGPRFDWSGMVALAEWNGHTFLGSWREPPHKPRANDDAAGTAEELGMGPLTSNPGPVGYEDAEVGAEFLKIGVGRLVKVREPVYSFGALYRISAPCSWDVRTEPGLIAFETEEKPLRGHAFRYSKTVSILPDRSGFQVERRLENTGSTRIVQTHYSHNFLRIDDEPVGRAYSVELPFVPRLEQEAGGILVVRGSGLSLGRDPSSTDGFFGLLSGFGSDPGQNSVTVRTRQAAVRITGSLPVDRMQFFGTGRTICPESFVRIELEPARSASWTTTYELLGV
jgi:hypothetical protein